MVAGAVVLVLVGLLGGRSQATSVTANTPVDAGARQPGNIDANNSPTLVQDPRHPENLVVVGRVDSPAFSCSLTLSHDRGAHWSPVTVPIPRGEEPKCYAPDAAWAPDGTLYVSYVTLRGNGNTPHAIWVVRSDDAGRTLSRPRRASGPLAFQVRLTVDPSRRRRVYLTWLEARTVGLFRFPTLGNPIRAARSDDGGRTWGPSVRVSASARQRVLAPAPVVGPDGTLYVLYLDVGKDILDYAGGNDEAGGPPYPGRFTLVLGRSTDGGRTWEESVVDRRVVPTRRFIAFLPPTPSLAVDRHSGRLFAAFEDGRRGNADVLLWSLGARARRWTAPIQVNDTPAGDRTFQYLPKVAVAPDGRLDVVYYDRRDDGANRHNEVSLQSSVDAGRTFTPRTVLSDRPFDARVGPGSDRGLPDLGNRLGLVSDGSAALAAWTDTRAGTQASNKQDIAFAAATLPPRARLSAPSRQVLRFGAVAALLVGALLLTRGVAAGEGPHGRRRQEG